MGKYEILMCGGKPCKAYYCNSIPAFINDDANSIIGELVRHSFEVSVEQTDAWTNQINGLKDKLKIHGVDGDIIFEYDIIRMGKRIDVVMLIRHMVYSLEFKNGKRSFEAKDAQQAEDYATDIKNFHKESNDLYVCPILIATEAPSLRSQRLGCYSDKQIYLQRENMETLVPKVIEISKKYGDDEAIDCDQWLNSPYYPTPTIIDAAIEAYNTHDLSSIAQSEAGQENINACEEALVKIIENAKKDGKKCVCFVTGVPGAGKTLVGLDVVAKSMASDEGQQSAYISGNGALVKVLQESLRRSIKGRKKKLDSATRVAIESMIQGSYAFKRANATSKDPTVEHVLIFDEAQRVWDENKMSQKHRDDPSVHVSEPHLLYSIMDRHDDWAVMVCLVGLGQDIYDGEVGINEWFRCGVNEFAEWEMYYSPAIFSQSEDRGIDREMIEGCPRCHPAESLHLKTSIRSFRAESLSQFVDALLDGRSEKASELYGAISAKDSNGTIRYPIYITRDFKKAKKWVRSQIRGSQRCGVLASSSAQRLKAEGIYVPQDIDVENWFLAPSNDLRSSNMMEVVASEFKVQGLEIDWAVVCWDADLRRNSENSGWEYYSFKGTKWNRRNKEEQRRYLVNSYRVLLTRARQGMILFVPEGVDPEEDPTRNQAFYNGVYDYLRSCGIQELDDAAE